MTDLQGDMVGETLDLQIILKFLLFGDQNHSALILLYLRTQSTNFLTVGCEVLMVLKSG